MIISIFLCFILISFIFTDSVDISKDKILKKMSSANMIYVDGGNTFYLQKYILQSSFWKSLQPFLDKGKSRFILNFYYLLYILYFMFYFVNFHFIYCISYSKYFLMTLYFLYIDGRISHNYQFFEIK